MVQKEGIGLPIPLEKPNYVPLPAAPPVWRSNKRTVDGSEISAEAKSKDIKTSAIKKVVMAVEATVRVEAKVKNTLAIDAKSSSESKAKETTSSKTKISESTSFVPSSDSNKREEKKRFQTILNANDRQLGGIGPPLKEEKAPKVNSPPPEKLKDIKAMKLSSPLLAKPNPAQISTKLDTASAVTVPPAEAKIPDVEYKIVVNAPPSPLASWPEGCGADPRFHCASFALRSSVKVCISHLQEKITEFKESQERSRFSLDEFRLLFSCQKSFRITNGGGLIRTAHETAASTFPFK
jgi:hypothetical protein